MNSKKQRALLQAWEARLGEFGLSNIERGNKIRRQVFSTHNSNAKPQGYYASLDRSLSGANLSDRQKRALALHAKGYSLNQIRKQLSSSFVMPQTRSGMHKLIARAINTPKRKKD